MCVDVAISDWMPVPAEIGDCQIFAVGDVHGMSRHFEAILEAMSTESKGVGELVLLGDLIDRGPDSVGTLRTAARSAADLGFASKTVLVGNHELLMMEAMQPGPGQERALQIWIGNGGDEMLIEVGILPYRAHENPQILDSRIRERLGVEVIAMLDGMLSHVEIGNVLFVHGGVDPAVPIEEWFTRRWLPGSRERDHFAWIRGPFLSHQGQFEGNRIVVHGHSPENRVMEWKGYPQSRAHMLDGSRIGLDGGTVVTGRVVGAEIQTGRYRLYTAS